MNDFQQAIFLNRLRFWVELTNLCEATHCAGTYAVDEFKYYCRLSFFQQNEG